MSLKSAIAWSASPANRERAKAAARARRIANPEKYRQRERVKREANRDANAEYLRRWRGEHPETIRQYYRTWRKSNPERARMKGQTRYAREMAAFVEYVDPAVVWTRDGGLCHLCGLPADITDWHLEHVVPLAHGGEHSYANTAVSHPLCNLRKGTR